MSDDNEGVYDLVEARHELINLIGPYQVETQGDLLVEWFRTCALREDLYDEGDPHYETHMRELALEDGRESAHIWRVPCEWEFVEWALDSRPGMRHAILKRYSNTPVAA